MFLATTEFGQLKWEAGIGFTGDPRLLWLVNDLIESGYRVPSLPAATMPKASGELEWLAWLTAKYAIEDMEIEAEWSPEPPGVREKFYLPPNVLA